MPSIDRVAVSLRTFLLSSFQSFEGVLDYHVQEKLFWDSFYTGNMYLPLEAQGLHVLIIMIMILAK